MRIFLHLLWIVLIFIGVAFALLNSTMVPVNFFFGTHTLYLPLLMLIILVVGALLGMLALLPKLMRK